LRRVVLSPSHLAHPSRSLSTQRGFYVIGRVGQRSIQINQLAVRPH
jgi:hypothetical protein